MGRESRAPPTPLRQRQSCWAPWSSERTVQAHAARGLTGAGTDRQDRNTNLGIVGRGRGRFLGGVVPVDFALIIQVLSPSSRATVAPNPAGGPETNLSAIDWIALLRLFPLTSGCA